MLIETKRLVIKDLTLEMADDVYINSIDEDNMKYLPDEVFTKEEAMETVEFLIEQYKKEDGPFVYAVFNKETNKYIGHVELILLPNKNYEIGYHIGKKYTGFGYAKEAVNDFVKYLVTERKIKKIYGISLKENIASIKVLEKCNFKKIYDGIGEYQGENKEIVKYIYSIE